MIETEDNMTVDDPNRDEHGRTEDSVTEAQSTDGTGWGPDDAQPGAAPEEPGAPGVALSPAADAPPVETEPEDERLRQLEEIDRNVKESGTPSHVEELEYVPLPKRRRGAPKDEDLGDLELTSVAEARGVLEAFLFTTNEPIAVARLSKLMNNLHPRTVRGLLWELQTDWERRGGALQIVEVAGGFQMATRSDYADWVFRLHKHRRRNPLTAATLETLAIIAYKQPATKAEVETIRGVESSATLRTLIDHGLVEIAGRREVLGRPQLYATTELFLKTFGLKSIADLPPISELKSLFAEEQKLKRSAAASSQQVTDDCPAPALQPEPDDAIADTGEDMESPASEASLVANTEESIESDVCADDAEEEDEVR